MPDVIAPVLCVRVADVTAATPPPPGSKVTRCRACREPVYVTRSTQKHIADGLMRPVCRQCLPPGRRVPCITGEQARELASWLASDPTVN